jgi:drug/metabolite transporter (DMT)-like permease
MTKRYQSLLYLHLAVFLWGFTAILGKLISYNSFNLVWHRMLLAAAVYFCFPAVWRSLRTIGFRNFLLFMGIGLIVALHWLTFYGSIKLGNSASITLACLGSASLFSAIFDPLINKKAFNSAELLLGFFVLAGIFMVYFSLPEKPDSGINYSAAIVSGVISAALAALFTALNKKHIEKTSPIAISAIEMLSGALVLSIVFPIFTGPEAVWIPGFDPSHGNYDLVWVLLLVLVCTNFTFYLGTRVLKNLSAFTANITVNLEPIYGIILGALIFGENRNLSAHFYLGVTLILTSVFLQNWLEYRPKKE